MVVGGQGGALPSARVRRWVKGAGPPPCQVGAGGGLAALYRILGIAFSLAYCSIGVGIGWVVGYRFRQSFQVGCQHPRSGAFTHCLARRLAAAFGRRFGFDGGLGADAQDSGFPCGLADIRV